MTDLSPVSRTAIGVARVRAHESAREDRLFDDPYAAGIAAAFPDDEGSGASEQLRRFLHVQIVMRTRFYDDHLLTSGHRQVVLLGAGLDTRAFRLPWPEGTRLFELDLPAVIAAKAGLVDAASQCERRALGADLTERWAESLVEQGFSSSMPTAWLAEGLLVYLPPEGAERLLEQVSELSATGSTFALEQGRARPPEDGLTRMWQGGVEDAQGWLERHGWDVRAHRLDDVAAGYGRPLSRQTTSGFLTATRRGPSPT